jgi:hypothetical protein
MPSEKPTRITTFLVVRDGVKPDWVAIWDTIEITVGRHESQDIAVREAEVSRKHCVFRQKNGVYTLEDLGSALGTQVNGESIKLHELASGDVISVGSFKMKFGQTPNPIKPGANVRFASQLKGFSVPGSPSGRAGRPHDDGDRPRRHGRHEAVRAEVGAEAARRVARWHARGRPTHPTTSPATSGSARVPRCATSTPRSPTSTTDSGRRPHRRCPSPQRRARPVVRRMLSPRRYR